MDSNGIYKKLLNIQQELNVPKEQTNAFGKYKYRSLEDILEAVKPLLNEEKAVLIIDDEIINIEERFYVKATAHLICTETKERVKTTAFAREDQNKKGMDLSQLTGSTSSYARKYALNALFCIDDTKDSDATNKHEDRTKASELSQAQIKRLYAIAYSNGFTDEDVKKVMEKDYKKSSAKDLSKKEYDSICKRLESSNKGGSNE